MNSKNLIETGEFLVYLFFNNSLEGELVFFYKVH